VAPFPHPCEPRRSAASPDAPAADTGPGRPRGAADTDRAGPAQPPTARCPRRARPGRRPVRAALLALLCGLADGAGAEADSRGGVAVQAGTAPGGTLLTVAVLPDEQTPLLRLPPTLSAAAGGRRGQRLFAADWLRDPPRPAVLGPDFDRAGCLACHREGLARAAAAAPAPEPIVRLLRVADRARFGGQLSSAALPGRPPQGRLVLRWEEHDGQFADGTPYRLRRPLISVRLGDGDDDGALGPVGLRMPPALFGWGLLEAIDETVLNTLADPDDRDGNGISGRVNRVPDLTTGRPRAGRFGWKAEQPSLLQQTAAALHNDMGITTSLFPDPACGAARAACLPELGDADLALLVEHQRWLGVPERRRPEAPQVLRGQTLFDEIGCGACHLRVVMTGRDAAPGLADQIIWPYSDLLLHDLGADLADPASGPEDTMAREWRTAPLWGIGLLQERLPARGLLHDGRARNLLEAILWHGGEAAPARDRVKALDRTRRAALLAFLESL